MSSSYIVEPQDSQTNKDDTLIIVVNDDGTIAVDQETLQNLIMSQSDANVSVVRIGQSEGDAENGELTFTVDPPLTQLQTESESSATFQSDETTDNSGNNNINGPTDSTGLVDPFMEMDPEQLEKLETALQSEQAKQILGENVAAMLDMLTIEEQQNSLKYAIELDHCYTSRTSPADPEPLDPLPVTNSPKEIETDAQSVTSPSVSTSESAKSQLAVKNLKTKQPVGRPRKTPLSNSQLPSGKTIQSDNRKNSKTEEQDDEDSIFSESSESDTSDNDSDFGPRGPRKSGIRARGGRRGLTTRGGSIGTRRRGSNKRVELEQSRNDISSTVDSSVKNSDKNDKSSHQLIKKQIKTLPIRKKDETSPLSTSAAPTSSSSSSPSAPSTNESPIIDKPLQTTNQVKANLINANMFKGDMIVTKPGQNRNNSFKVYFVPKKVTMKPTNDVKSINVKQSSNSLVLTKESLVKNQIQTKLGTSEDGKLITVTTKPSLPPNLPLITTSITTTAVMSEATAATTTTTVTSSTTSTSVTAPMEVDQINVAASSSSNSINQKQSYNKLSKPSSPKMKIQEIKIKEKKKSESESSVKIEDSLPRTTSVDPKTPDLTKKHVKKEQRKSSGSIVDSLGPALFSTPDIIRRVGSSTDLKSPDDNNISESISNSSTLAAIPSIKSDLSLDSQLQPETDNLLDSVSEVDSQDDQSSLMLPHDEEKNDSKLSISDDLQPNLDTVTSATPKNEEVSQNPEVPVPNIISEQSGIENEEHLLDSLDMVKHEDELLAEVFLFQQQLEFTDPDTSALDEPTSAIPDNLLPPSSSSSSSTSAAASVYDTTMLPTTNTEMPAVIPAEMHISTVPASSLNSPVEQNKKKNATKEPIQIVRGGRVVILPPIEAPTTRSKKSLQQVQQQQQQQQQHQHQHQHQHQDHQMKLKTTLKMGDGKKKEERSMRNQQNNKSSYDDSDYEDDDNSDSEDDPNRLWCICKQPHNNRFMICCDVCEDWFHGKCVNITKSMGSQMENQGIEWVCPNCTKKKTQPSSLKSQKTSQVKSSKPSERTQYRHKSSDSQSSESQSSIKSSNIIKMVKSTTSEVKQLNHVAGTVLSTTQCVVCKKEARNSSIYCSDECILLHAKETCKSSSSSSSSPPSHSSSLSSSIQPLPTSQIKVTTSKTPENNKTQSEGRVIVIDKKNHKLLTGTDAPLQSNLQNWLKENPGFETVQINSLNSIKIGGKTAKLIKANPQQLIASSNQPAKMIFAKIAGSKQTVLAPSKKLAVISKVQNVNILPKPTQMVISSSSSSPSSSTSTSSLSSSSMNKTPVLKQTTIKTVPLASKTSTFDSNKGSLKSTPGKSKHELQSKPSTSVQKLISKSVSRKSDQDPIRLNVRNTLTELLTTRIRETDDLKLTDDEISNLALNIELEMYRYFRDANQKYKNKHRSLVFNIKDTKNLTLFRKIADGSLTPEAVVKLSPQEMASQELAEWREKETKHQLEMIKKNELDMMAQAKSIVVKTHKGEQIIESDNLLGAVDPKTPVQDIVSVLNNTDNTSFDILDEKEETTCSSIEDVKKKRTDEKKKKDKDRHKDRSKDRSRTKDRSKDRDSKDKRDSSRSRSRHHRSSRDRRRSKDGKKAKERDFEKNKEKSKDKKDKDRSHKNSNSSSSNSSNRSKSSHRDKEKKRHSADDEFKRECDKSKKEISNQLIHVEKQVDDNLWKHVEEESTTQILDGHDSDVSDREPSSTVNIKTPDINDDTEREKEEEITELSENNVNNETSIKTKELLKLQLPSVWRGFINMPDVAKFCSSAQEIRGNAKGIMKDLPDTLNVGGRIPPEPVWEYIVKMVNLHNKEITLIRLTAVNDEEKIPYITLYSSLHSRDRFGVINNLSKNIKDFYIIPFSSTCTLHPALLPINEQAFEENRPPLLLGIIVPNFRKRMSHLSNINSSIPPKLSRKSDRSYTPPPLPPPPPPPPPPQSQLSLSSSSSSSSSLQSSSITSKIISNPYNDKLTNKSQLGLSKTVIDSATISKIVPELSSKIDLTSSPDKTILNDDDVDDDDEPYSPGDMDDDNHNTNDEIESNIKLSCPENLLELAKNPNELQRKMNELDRKIAEEKQKIQSISSSFLSEALPTLPGLGLDPDDEAYSPTDIRSLTPPPPPLPSESTSQGSTPGLNKFIQPILDKVSDITIPPNLQEILANVKRQESSKVDPYLPTKPSASFLTAMNQTIYHQPELTYTPTVTAKEIKKSKLGSLSDLELIRKAEEELAAVEAAKVATIESMTTIASTIANINTTTTTVLHPVIASNSIPTVDSITGHESSCQDESDKIVFPGNLLADQPKPPGVEDDDYIPFPSAPPKIDTTVQNVSSGSIKRKPDENKNLPSKPPRTKSRWNQEPFD